MSDFLAIILARCRKWHASCDRCDCSLHVLDQYIRNATAYLV